MEELPSIHRIDAGFTNAYLIDDGSDLALIDTGIVSTVTQIMKKIKDLGRSVANLKHIVLTHRHFDHVGGAAALKHASGATVWGPKPDSETISDQPAKGFPPAPVGPILRLTVGKRFTPPPCTVDEQLLDNTTLPFFGGLQIIWTPGHTYGHTSLYHSGARILFAGDAVITSGGRLRVTPPFICDDWEEACRTVRDRLMPLAIDHVLAGHGAPLHEGVKQQFHSLSLRYGGM
ncbi:MAG: hypothetical protein NVS4B8_00120 [Herpetosiphon sp.]